MNKKERKAFLKEVGLDKEDMKRFWKECLEVGVPAIINFDRAGMTWKDLPDSMMRSLPILKNRYLRQKEEDQLYLLQEEEEGHRGMPAEPSDEEAKEQSFEEEILRKLDSGERLSERELKELLFDGYEVSRTNGENRRWSRTVTTIVQVGERFFAIDWEEGLTENQENEFYNQPVEVEMLEYEKTITVTEWVPVNREKESTAEPVAFAYSEENEEEEERE